MFPDLVKYTKFVTPEETLTTTQELFRNCPLLSGNYYISQM
jgi:hypothetical protein